MARFRFRLQALLDTADHEENALRREVQRMREAEERERKQYSAMVDVRRQWEARIRECQRGGMSLVLLNEHLRGVGLLQQKVVEQQQHIDKIRAEVGLVRDKLAEAAAWRKSLERLRDRLKSEHRSDEAVRQTKISDEMATLRAATRSAGVGDEMGGDV